MRTPTGNPFYYTPQQLHLLHRHIFQNTMISLNSTGQYLVDKTRRDLTCLAFKRIPACHISEGSFIPWQWPTGIHRAYPPNFSQSTAISYAEIFFLFHNKVRVNQWDSKGKNLTDVNLNFKFFVFVCLFCYSNTFILKILSFCHSVG